MLFAVLGVNNGT